MFRNRLLHPEIELLASEAVVLAVVWSSSTGPWTKQIQRKAWTDEPCRHDEKVRLVVRNQLLHPEIEIILSAQVLASVAVVLHSETKIPHWRTKPWPSFCDGWDLGHSWLPPSCGVYGGSCLPWRTQSPLHHEIFSAWSLRYLDLSQYWTNESDKWLNLCRRRSAVNLSQERFDLSL